MPDYLENQGQDNGGFESVLNSMRAKYGETVKPVMPRAPRVPAFDAPARIRELAPSYGVPEDLALKVLGQESRGHQYGRGGSVLTSPKGAKGAMQVLPATGRSMGYDVNDPEQNVNAGLDYLGRSYKRWNGDEALTLAGYHSGIEDAEKALRNPRGNPKTHGYVKAILGDDSYNQVMSRYGAPSRNAFDDVLSNIKAKYEPQTAPQAGNSFDDALKSVKAKYDAPTQAAPKQIYADELSQIAKDKFGGDELAATTDYFNQGYQIMQRVNGQKPLTVETPALDGKVAAPPRSYLPHADTSDPFDVPVKLGVTQKADEPVAPDVENLAPTFEGDYSAGDAARLALRDKQGNVKPAQNFAGARPLYLGDLKDKIAAGDVATVTEEINKRAVEDLAAQFKLTPEQVSGYLKPYSEDQIRAALPGLLDDLNNPEAKGYVAHPLPADYAQQLTQLHQLKKYENLTSDQKVDEAYRIAKDRPLTLAERQALDAEHGWQNYPVAFSTGAAQAVSETAAGLGRMTHIKPLQELGETGITAARAFSNITQPEGVGGALAHSGGHLAVEMPGALALPGGAAAHAAYWAGLSATQSMGRGESPEQAMKSAAIAAMMIGATKPLAPLAGAAADTFKEIAVKAGTRAAGGYALGYGLARSQGAKDEDAHAQGLLFAGMNLAGGRRSPVNSSSMRTDATEPNPMPESRATVNEQMQALQAGRRGAVIVTPGTEVPEVPKGFVATETPKGTVIHDPRTVTPEEVLAKVADGTHGELVGHVEPKGENTNQIVVARNPKTGVEQQASYVSPENVDKQAAEFQRQFPGAEISVGGKPAEQALLDERAKALQADSHHSNYQPRDEVTKQFVPGSPELPPRPFDEVVKQAAESKPAADEPEFVRAARERLRNALQGNTLSANPINHLFDTAIITGYDVFKGTMDKAAWAREMTLRLGRKVKPILDDVWDHLTTGKFGPADVKRQLEQTRLVPAKMIQEVLSGERPEHVNSIVDFLTEQREKVVKGAMTPSDVAKAYYITVASQGTDAMKVETLQRKLAELGVEMKIPADYATANKKGEAVIRPEDAAGLWLMSEKGQEALKDLEAGRYNESAWREGAKVRSAFGDDRVTKNNVLGRAAKGSFNMRNVGDLVAALNEAKGDARKVGALAGRLNGVGIGKTPFMKHLLGFGDSPTVDAVEINTWLTGRGSTKGQSGRAVELARAVKDFTGNPGVMEAVSDRITRRFNDLRRSGVVGQDLTPDTFGHVVHHWLWDAMKGTTNPQKGMYEAMRSEPDFVARSRDRLRETYSGSRLNANPIQDIYDLAIVTGYDLYNKAKGFADWSKRMVDELGPDVKDHLTHVWGQLEGESNKMFAESLNRPASSFDEALASVKARVEPPQYDESVMDSPESYGRTSPLSTLDSYIRANILAGPSPITHKLGSLTASAITDEVARPFAAAVDKARSVATGTGRALFEDPRGLARATVAAITKGIPEMGQILRRGYTPEQIARGELPYEIKGRPIIGDYINLVFRTYKAGVHPFEVFAYTRAMENQARVAAEAELKAGTIAPSEVAARATEIAKGQNVDPATAGQMELNASIAAADATFRADSPVSRGWSKWRRSAGPRWAFVMNRAFEFTRTPINAVIKTVELTPGLGQAKELLTELRSKAKTGEWLPDDVDKARFAKAWGALPVGAGLFMLGSALHRRGLMTGFVDDHKRKGMDYAEGRTPGSLKIAPDTWLDVMRFSPPGVVMSMGATWDYYTNEKSPGKGTIKDAMSDLYHALMPAAESLPFMQNPSRIFDPKAQAAKLIPGYSTVRDVYRGNQSTIGQAVPPARWLFGQRGADVLGRPTPDQGFVNTVLHIRHGQPSVALDELRANGVTYSRPWRRPEESRKAYDARVKAQGESIEQRVASLKAAPQYQDGDDEFRRKALETAQLVSREDAEMGREPREGDAAVLLYNARVALQTRDLLRDLRRSEAYRKLQPDERQHFERAVQQRMQGAHARVSGEDSIGERISAAAGRFRELLADRGALVRDAVKRAHGGHQ